MIKGSSSVTLVKNVDIDVVWRYYLVRSSTLATPVIENQSVRPPATSGVTWTTVEPSYTEGSTNTLYFVDCMVYSDGSISYSSVSRSTSYEAAKAAYNKAVNANNKIDEVTDNIYQNDTTFIDGSKIYDGSIEGDQIKNGSLSIDQMDETVAGTYSDTEARRGSIKWEEDSLHIKSMDSAEQNVYETVIGGDGIKFNWNNVETASINQDELKISKTVVINAMEVGNWSWAIHPVTGNLMVKWNGGD